MAELSSITLPNGNTYNFKDATARSSSGVTGVKGNSESSYRTGNVNLTAQNIGAYATGVSQIHRNPNNSSADPQHTSLANSKNTIEYEFIKPIAGIGDWFYAAHLNNEYTITSNYSGRNGTKGNFAISTLFTPSAASTTLLDVNSIAETPFVLQIEKASVITATDVVHLELWGHTINGTSAALSDYKVELLTTGSSSSSGDFSWQTVYQRSNVSDKINGLSICLNPTNYSFLYFKGLRFTISGAIPGSTSESAWNYNCIDLSLFRLVDQRPAFSAARAVGALDLAGGTVFGQTTFLNGITGNLTGNASSATNATSANTATAVATQGNGTINAYRHVWFSDSSTETKRAHDDDFTYNPSSNTLKVANVDGKINGHTVNKDVPADAVFTDTTNLSSMTGTLGLDHGGTGATSAAAARTNLGLGSAALASTAAAVGNNTNLPTGAAVQTYVSSLVAGVLHYKGTKSTVANLPTSGNTTGDVWHVTQDGSEWAWDGSAWQELGTAIDLSNYVTNVTASTVSVGSASAGTAIPADDITAWTTNTPTAVTPATVVTGGSTATITPVTKKTVVTGGSTTEYKPVTGISTGSGTAASASVANGVLTITNGSTPITSVTASTVSIKPYTGLTTGDSVTNGTAVTVYKSLTTGPAATVTAGTAASLSYTSKSIPNISVTSKNVVSGITVSK